MIKDNSKLKPQEFETHWQKLWEEKRVYQPDLSNANKPFYNLMMFPYPSAEGLHVGNMYAFTGADINGRYKRMQGYDVFEPIGLDGFGIHSENYAIKIGKHPAEQAKISEKNFYRQLKAIGNGFAWENHLETYDPDYYRWTQWIFIRMFKAGLAYRKKSPVNFCPSCKTVLSDEQVIDGSCERCKSKVEKRDMEQWYFRITKYADKLLNNIEKLEWTNKVKVGQRNWIGKKEGINITYPVVDIKGVNLKLSGDASGGPPTSTQSRSAMKSQFSDKKLVGVASGRTRSDNLDYISITCFTTRPDTNFGATFVVIGPEHPFVASLLRASPSSSLKLPNSLKKHISDYIEKAKKTSEQDRIAAGRQKTGVFTGFYAVNQLNGYKMPIYISDFVLGHVGTGAVVGVPGHDLRDFEFAKEFDIPIIRVVVGKDGDTSGITKTEQVQEEEGVMVNSEFLNGLDIHQATVKMMDHLVEKDWGKRVTTFKLRDWCISRQRYWGAPIPMIFCSKCAKNQVQSSKFKVQNQGMAGWFPVPEDQLPVLLPKDVKDWKPEGTGKGPLAKIDSFVKTKCPNCGGKADRETDVCDTFLDSSWYHLRYPSISVKNPNFKIQIPNELKPKETILKTGLMGKTSINPKTSHYEGEIRNFQGLGESEKFVSEDSSLPWDPQITRRWLPVTQYIGGAEHTVLHLLYARFVWMCFYDWGLFGDFSAKSKHLGGPATMPRALGWEEPYTRFYAHGLIIAEGAKMSKSKGNVVIPDEYIRKYGADTLRTYLMFLGPFDMGGDFKDTGIAGMYRFLSRVWRLINEFTKKAGDANEGIPEVASPSLSPTKWSDFEAKSGTRERQDPLTKIMHHTIKEVTDDLEGLRYNTAIAHIMEFVNEIGNWKLEIGNSAKEVIETLLLLLAPFAPFMTEELWQKMIQNNVTMKQLNNFSSIHLHPWPKYDPKYLEEDVTTIIIQINGKVRETIQIQRLKIKDQRYIEEISKNSEKVKKHLEGKSIRKVIFVPGKLINFVV